MGSTRTIGILGLLGAGWITVAGCAPAGAGSENQAPAPRPGVADAPRFADLPPEHTGIDFAHAFEWQHPRKHLYQHGYAGGGVAVGDYDDDGLPDVYLVSQTGRDRLYRNLGDLRFEDVTDAAGLTGGTDWGTGAAFADVDGDGDLDLYVCNYDAPNLLYVNRGDGTFREQAAGFGIDYRGASVMATFADYDLDGSVDMYLLTNRLYPGPALDVPEVATVNGPAGPRTTLVAGQEDRFAVQRRPVNGRIETYIVKAGERDRLYRNVRGRFVDVSDAAGIDGHHPGLSATWWDFDEDGDLDLYVGNDFWDPDRLYRNEGDGTFTDVVGEVLPHTTWFSMGADVADVNNDGRDDFMTADMSPTTHYMAKIMMGDMNESRWFLESASPRQYMRNALYLNTGTERLMEIAALAGVVSTDWTWSLKFGDLDNDGHADLFVTNGSANHSFDPDLTRRMRAADAEQRRAGVTDPVERWEAQWAIYRSVPPREEANLAFRNTGSLAFEDVSETWGLDHRGISFGAALADLDRDGDLDVVVNNVDDRARVYRNDGTAGNGIVLRLAGRGGNRYGLGAKVTAETASGTQVRRVNSASGYMSANEPLVHFGLGDDEVVDRLTVEWPGGRVQELRGLPAGALHVITEPAGPPPPRGDAPAPPPRRFHELAIGLGLEIPARPERPYDDYARQPLLPARHSQLGPPIAWGDADGDGTDDLYIGGPAGRSGYLFLADATGRYRQSPGPWSADAASEDIAALWIDADVDGDLDLYVGSGSVECEPGDPVLADRLYVNQGGGTFERAPEGALPEAAESTGTVVGADYDRDGDVDLFVGARVIPGRYPLTPRSRLLRNDGGRFTDVTEDDAPGLESVGMVTAALWSDADGDGWQDLLVCVEWGPVALWHNDGGALIDRTRSAGLADRTGWWSGITGADLDGDGDIDYAVSNAGLNIKYHASEKKPAMLYYGDFEGNGGLDVVEIKCGADDLLPVRGLSCLSEAMPFVREVTPTYHDFASSTAAEIFDERMRRADSLSATCLESGVLINDAGTFEFRALPRIAQAAPGRGIVATELDGDGQPDVYMAQNDFWREPETGHWDGGLSILLGGAGDGTLEPVEPAASGLVVAGDARGAALCDPDGDGRPDLAVMQNNDRMLVFRNQLPPARRFLAVRLAGGPGNPACAGARVTVTDGNGGTQTAEVYAGSGYATQSAPTLYFGWPPGTTLREVKVRWPDGRETVEALEPLDRRLLLYEPPRSR